VSIGRNLRIGIDELMKLTTELNLDGWKMRL